MDPQVKSLVTTIGAALAAAIAGAAATHGWITSGQQAALTDILTTMGGTVALGLLAWYSRRTASPKALIRAVNAGDNGVKVVASPGPGQAVNGPLKEAGK